MLALQRTAGNVATGGMLQRARVLARERTKESLEGAYREFAKCVGSTDVFGFIARLRSEGSMPDGRCVQLVGLRGGDRSRRRQEVDQGQMA